MSDHSRQPITTRNAGWRISAAVVLVTAWLSAKDLPADEPPPALARWLEPQAWHKDTAGPILSLGTSGEFDDMHLFAPAVANVGDAFYLWYPGSRGSRTQRVFRLGLATSPDGKEFRKYPENPVLDLNEGTRSILTPALLRNPDGTTLREGERLRMWFTAADLTKGGLHTLHETSSDDGIHWSAPSAALLDHCYCPTVLKIGGRYEMWFSDVSKRPWLIRHAASDDGTKWTVDERPVLQLSQGWEAEVLVYPTVLAVDGIYLMWYGSYNTAVRRQTTAIGFAASTDGLHWHKHPQNPVIRPDEARLWESNYVGSGCVMRLADGSYRYWYASRTKPPFEHLYFAISTARWTGPQAAANEVLELPPVRGTRGRLDLEAGGSPRRKRQIEVLEIIDGENAIVRVWHASTNLPMRERTAGDEPTFADLWLAGIDTSQLQTGAKAAFSETFEAAGTKSFPTTCGSRVLPLLKAGAPQ